MSEAGAQHAGESPGAALVAEACRRSPLVWVRVPPGRAQPVWSVWHDGAVLVVVGGQEQPDPLPAGATEVEVSVRSKAVRSRLVTFRASVDVLDPSDERWAAAVEALRGERLNARHAESMPERWAAASRVLRLEPTGVVVEEPGRYDESVGALPPAPSNAVTVRRRPFHLGRRPRRR